MSFGKNLSVNNVVFGFDSGFLGSQGRKRETKDQDEQKISTSQGPSCSLHETSPELLAVISMMLIVTEKMRFCTPKRAKAARVGVPAQLNHD
jgi:hypothetical protein